MQKWKEEIIDAGKLLASLKEIRLRRDELKREQQALRTKQHRYTRIYREITGKDPVL